MSSSAKRFFDNNWEHEYFTSLSAIEKLLYKYIWERSDIGGICQINTTLMTAFIKEDINLELIKSVIDKVNVNGERFRLIDNDKIWIKEYARFQQKHNGGSLSKSSPPHKSVVSHLKRAGVFNEAVENDPELFENFEVLTLRQPLDKGYSNSNGINNGSSNDNGSSSTSYSQSKSIAERLFIDESIPFQKVVNEINSLAKSIENKGNSENDSFKEINYALSEMEDYYPKSELTIEALKEKMGCE